MLHHHEIRGMGDRLSAARDLCIGSSYDEGINMYRDVLTQLKPAIKRVSQGKERQDWLQVQSDLESELGAMMDYVDALHTLKQNAPGQKSQRPRSSTPADRPKSGNRWQGVDNKRGDDQGGAADPDVWAPPSPDAGRGRRGGPAAAAAPNWADKQKKKAADGEKPKYSEVAREQGWCDVELIEGIERDIVDTGPKITFDDIAGLEHTKELLQEAVMLPQIAPHLFKARPPDGRLKPCNGVLMFGPPGTGKTLLAKAVANVCNSTFFNVSASTLASKYRGESEKMVRILFEMARYYSPAIIFMDEIDAIAGARGGAEEHESSRRVKTELLVQINGVGSGEKSDVENNRVMVLAATNLPWQIDEAMRRRLTKRVCTYMSAFASSEGGIMKTDCGLDIPLPDVNGRRALFNLNLKRVDVAPDVDYDRLATQTENDIVMALENVSKSVGQDQLVRFQKWEEEFGSK
ncbi:hypothetical protein DYB37_007136 [Aphanomyces astaci]|uniref:AAA+ ATPase domain-containing protein n=2 Tax=Aphanomyces astaci TaxID=112090 RepID=A0A3R6XZA7_APHAT|nr:hypothetical protein DYB35_005418 [Aphanomyces astaci]RHZ27800.1 hypothetical protein DYB37_007136 [Aphanomyces astaci]